MALGINAVESQMDKAQVQQRARRLGGVTMPPVVGVQMITQVGNTGIGVEVKATPAQYLPGGWQNYGEIVGGTGLLARTGAPMLQGGLGFFWRFWLPRHVAHDARVCMDMLDSQDIPFIPFAQQQSFRVN